MFTFKNLIDDALVKAKKRDENLARQETRENEPITFVGNRFDNLESEFSSQDIKSNMFDSVESEFKTSIGEGVERTRTELDPVNEDQFKSWYQNIATKTGIDPDPDNPEHKYDYRGAYKVGYEPKMDQQSGEYHWPSQFKDNDHPNRFVDGIDTKNQVGVRKTYPELEQEGLYEGLVKPTGKSLVKVPTAILGSMALMPGAGISAGIKLLPQVDPKMSKEEVKQFGSRYEQVKSKLAEAGYDENSELFKAIINMPSSPKFKSGSLEEASKTFNQVMSVPSSVLTTKADVQAVENLMAVMKPIEMAGEGWKLIGEQVDKGLQELGLAPTYLEPLLGTYGEAAAIFALPEVIKGIKGSDTFRQLNVKERGLVVQSLAEMKAKNPGMTEGEILREFNNPNWMAEALEKRSVTEDYAKVKQAAEDATMAAAETAAKSKVNNPPKPKSVDQPMDVDPEFTFTNKKGEVLSFVNGEWYNSKGKKMTNQWAIKAAEKGKVRFAKDEDVTAEKLKKDIEEHYKKDIDEVSDKEIEDYVDMEEKIKAEVKGEPIVKKPSPEPTINDPNKGTYDDIQAEIDNYTDFLINKYGDGILDDILEYKVDLTLNKGKQKNPISDDEFKTFSNLYDKRDSIGKVELNDFVSDVISKSDLDSNTIKSALEVSGIYSNINGIYSTSETLRKWQDPKTIEKLYNFFSDQDSHAEFRWEGTADNPTLIGASYNSDLMKAEWNKDALNKVENLYNIVAENIALDPIDLGHTKNGDIKVSKPLVEDTTANDFTKGELELIEMSREKFGKELHEITDEQLEELIVEREMGDEVNSEIELTNFRQEDPKITKHNLDNMRPYNQIDNVDSLIGRMEAEVNGWLDGLDVDINATKDLIGKLADNAAYWADGSETPPAFFGHMSQAGRMNFAEYMEELDNWVEEVTAKNGEGGVKLHDIGSATGEAFKWLYDKITKRDKTKVQPPSPKPFIRGAAKELVIGRRMNLNVETFDTNYFVNSIEQRTSMAQREVMPFVIEGTEIPDALNRPDLQKVLAKNKESLQPIAEEVKDHFEVGFKRVKTHLKDLTSKQIRDYVTHLWDIPKNKQVEAINWFSTQDRFMERRFIDTYAEGIEKGYKPKTLDISEIIKIHDAVGNRAIENTRFIKALMKLKAEGIPLITRDEAPLDWVNVNYPALIRRVPLSKTQIKRKGEFVKESPVFVHPDLVRPLKVIFEQRFDGPVISAYEALNGIMKKSMLSVNLFHHTELAKVAVAEMGLAKTASVYFDPVKIYRSMVKGDFEVFRKTEIARDAAKHNLQFGPTSDIPVDRIQKALNDLAKSTQDTVMVGRITKLLAGINSAWDKALWNYLHDTLKLYAYESAVGKLSGDLTPDMIRKSKIEIAQRINDQFGGQNWDVVGLTPREVQAMTWGLLSADWTASTIRQGLALTSLGKIYKETAGLRAKGAAMFWLRAAIYFGIGLNLLNMFFRDKDMDENPHYYEDKENYTNQDKTMYWGNTIGNRNKLFVGRYDDGSERYVRWDKQMEDSLGLVYLPLEKKFQKLGGKVAPVPQALVEMFTGHTLSGFKNDDIYGKRGLDYAKGVVKRVGGSFLPLTLRKALRDNAEFHATDVFTQSSKGMSRFQAVEYFKRAIVEGNEDMLRDAYIGALRNNLPAFTLFNASLTWVEAESTKEVNKDIQSIEDAKAAFSVATNAFDKKRYGSKIAQLNKEKADKEAGIKLMRSALMRMRAYSEVTKEVEVPPSPRR